MELQIRKVGTSGCKVRKSICTQGELRTAIAKADLYRWGNQQRYSKMLDSEAPSRLVGYARVSTIEQELTLQIDALIVHGVNKEDIFTDKISGAKEERPGHTQCLESLVAGDTLIVWRLDRLGRSMRHLVN